MLESKYVLIVETSIDKAWKKLTDIKTWATWHPQVSQVKVEGKSIKIGTRFSYHYLNAHLKAEVIMVDRYRTFQFKVRAKGATRIHTWNLKPESECTIVDYEQRTGLMAWLLAKKFQTGIDEGVKAWVDNFAKSFNR